MERCEHCGYPANNLMFFDIAGKEYGFYFCDGCKRLIEEEGYSALYCQDCHSIHLFKLGDEG